MKNQYILLSTSPSTHPTRKPHIFANLNQQRRFLYRKPHHNNTGKEIDPETGLYYYGARYLDPKASRWLSGDPALGEYLPSAPVNDEARKRNGSLPGMGGVFNYVNLHVYHYGGNNPVNYRDPDGRDIELYGTPEEQITMLNLINEYSYKQYEIDENGKLYATNEINENDKSSTLYSDYLDKGIANTNTVSIVFLAPEGGYSRSDGSTINLIENGGGYTDYMVDKNNEVIRSIIITAITGNSGYDSTLGEVPSADVMMHELITHSIPLGLGGMDHENAIGIDNQARLQLGLEIRMPDTKHTVRRQ